MLMQHPFHRFCQVADYMQTIGTLNGFWCSLCRAIGVLPSTITADEQDAGMLAYPGGEGRGVAIWQQIDRCAPFEVH